VGTARGPFKKLCHELHGTRFTWSIRNDENRAEDGRDLRGIFLTENEYDENHLEVEYFLKGPAVSVLEVLVAIADRINGLMESGPHEDLDSSRWFRLLLENLTLNRFTDRSTKDLYFSPQDEREIADILERFINRTYERNGSGGLFPLHSNNKDDMRDVELWYQLMAYLEENYD
jgi:hypothetical protein